MIGACRVFVAGLAWCLLIAGHCLASFPTVNEFSVVDLPLNYYADWSEVAVDDSDRVHLVWTAQDGTPPSPGGMVSMRLYYCCFSSGGQRLTEIINLTTDRFLVRAMPAIGVNRAGKVAITDFVWDSQDSRDKLVIWFAEELGVFSNPPQHVGNDLANWSGNGIGDVDVDDRGWTYLVFENPYMATWEDNPGASVWMCIYNAANEKVGPTHASHSGNYDYAWCEYPRLSLGAADRVVLTRDATMDFRWWPNLNCRVEPLVRAFDLEGNPLGEENFIVCESPLPSCDADPELFPVMASGRIPAVSVRSNGDFAVAYRNQCYFECANEFYVLRLFNADGTAKGPNQRVNLTTDCYSLPHQIRLVGDSVGNLLACYTLNAYTPDPDHLLMRKNIWGQRFGPQGQRVGAPLRFNNQAATTYTGPVFSNSVAANDHGLLAVAWQAMDAVGSSGQYHIMLTIRDLYKLGFPEAGDADGSGHVTISDAVFLINYIFASGPAPYSECMGDANGDDFISVSDVVTLINYVFAGGAIEGKCTWD